MSADKFFPQRPDSSPAIYAYEDTNPQYKGLLKIGYTTVDVQARVAQQYPTMRPGRLPYRIVFEESAMRNDDTVRIGPLTEICDQSIRFRFDFRAGNDGAAVVDGAHDNDLAVQIDSSVQHSILL